MVNTVKNTIAVANLQASISADAQRLKHSAFICQPHSQVMNNLLQQITRVDFRELAELDTDKEEAKLRKEHYLVIAVEQVLEFAKRNQWGLCRRDAFFYTYNGAYWKPIDKDELKAFLRNAAERMGIDKFKARYVEFSKNLFDQFTETAYLPAPIQDRNSVKINLANGTFEISTESQFLRTPDATDFITHQLPFAYDPDETAPLFMQFLNRVQPDLDCQKLLAEYIGYVFVSPAKLKLEKTLLLHGSGANGKSVFFEIITALLGMENVSNYSLQSLTEEKGYHRANLANKLVNYASEISGRLDANLFKQLVSGEPIEARLPYGQPFILRDYAKLIFNCNELPADVEHTPAYFRRFLIVPFGVAIPEAEQGNLLTAYHDRLTSKDDTEAVEAALRWNAYETTCSSFFPRQETITSDDQRYYALAMAKIEAHYFQTQIIPSEKSLLHHIDKIRHIPGSIIHGRYDIICPMISAQKLHAAWPEADYVIVPDAGHSFLDPTIRSRLIEATDNAKSLR